MFSSTISLTPSAACSAAQDRAARRSVAAIARLGGAARRAPCGRRKTPVGSMRPSTQIGVGHGRLAAAAAVAGRARDRRRRCRGPTVMRFERVDPRDRAAAGADLDHLDDRDAQRQAAALLEAVDARDLEGARWSAAAPRRSGRSSRSCRPCRRTAPGRARAAGRCWRRRSRRRPGPDSTSRTGKRIAVSTVVMPPPDSHQEAAGSESPRAAARARDWRDSGPSAAAHRRWRRRSRSARIRASPATRRDDSVTATPASRAAIDLADAALVRRVGEAVQKADRDRLDAAARRARSSARATPASSSGTSTLPCASMRSRHRQAQPARHQRRRQVDIDVVLLEAVLVADLDRCRESPRW